MKKLVAVSGGFDPIHPGHIRLFKEAKKHGDRLLVILNNDNWLKKKKGYCLMNEDERMEVLRALRCVDDVVLSVHPETPKDMSISVDLRTWEPDVFVNAGDRTLGNVPEYAVCRSLGVQMVFNATRDNPYKNHSSTLLRKAAGAIIRKKKHGR